MNKTKNARIGLKVSLSIAIPLLALIAIAATSIYQIREMSSDLITTLLKQVNKSNALILNADRDYYQAMQAYLEMKGVSDPKVLESKATSFTENAQQTIERVRSAVNALKESPIMKMRHKTAKKDIASLLAAFESNFQQWYEAFDVSTNKIKDEQLFWTSFDNARDSINLITEIIEDYAQQSVKKSEEKVHDISVILIVISILVFIISAIIGMIFASSISRIITDSMEQLLFSANDIASISNNVADSSRKFAEASSEQAASVEEVSATLEETSAMVQANSENSQIAYKLSQKINEAINSGSSQMSEMSKSMNMIKDASGEITNVLKAIESIAFQTNILSLNAAVEAARAGDAGKGFAVVADEVRSLAHKSAREAQSISQILDKNLELTVSAAEVTAKAFESFKVIQKEINEISILIDGLAKAGEEQRIGISQISDTMQHMGQVVQNIASDASSNMQMAEKLLDPVEDMQSLARRLSVKGEKKE